MWCQEFIHVVASLPSGGVISSGVVSARGNVRLGGFSNPMLALFIPSGYSIGIWLDSASGNCKIATHIRRMYRYVEIPCKTEPSAALEDPKLGWKKSDAGRSALVEPLLRKPLLSLLGDLLLTPLSGCKKRRCIILTISYKICPSLLLPPNKYFLTLLPKNWSIKLNHNNLKTIYLEC